MTSQDTDQTQPVVDPTRLKLLEMASQIVSAHLGNAGLERDQVPGFIAEVMTALEAGLEGKAISNIPTDGPAPFVPVEESIHPDYLICLEDGAKRKMLKNYLWSRYKMTPEEYRTKWGLDPDYPMVAPNHSKLRSSLAKKSKLGHNRGKREKL
ncbi:MAG: MucR family transcriptional regulator [Alphaproteobacteria bacterium]